MAQSKVVGSLCKNDELSSNLAPEHRLVVTLTRALALSGKPPSETLPLQTLVYALVTLPFRGEEYMVIMPRVSSSSTHEASSCKNGLLLGDDPMPKPAFDGRCVDS
ncbi:hypothetical protein DFH06DRAFT_1338240 [Mycena polygramma]|nr:hypothetical protein DFH06DRAFT_1338240 [Mycena polygramma]